MASHDVNENLLLAPVRAPKFETLQAHSFYRHTPSLYRHTHCTGTLIVQAHSLYTLIVQAHSLYRHTHSHTQQAKPRLFSSVRQWSVLCIAQKVKSQATGMLAQQ